MSFWAQAYSKACAETGSPAVEGGLDELRRSVDGDEQVELALRSSNLGDVDMKVADRIGLEFAFGRGFAFDLRQPGDPGALQTPVKGRARQMRDRGLQGIKAVVER